jgi:hypothetical protein
VLQKAGAKINPLIPKNQPAPKIFPTIIWNLTFPNPLWEN